MYAMVLENLEKLDIVGKKIVVEWFQLRAIAFG